MASLKINQGTQSDVFFEDVGGTAFRQSVAVDHGTITLSNPTGTTVEFNNGTVNSVANVVGGTITRILQGSIIVTAGTVVNNGGTVGEVTSVTNIVNLAKGTITKIEGGTVAEVTSVANLVKGTVTRVEGGSIAVTLGTVVMNSGTLNVGTVVNNGGTVAEVTQLNGGSVRITVGTINVGTVVNNGGTVAEITNGTIRMTVGTVAAGSIAVIAGTVNAGTVNTGTVNAGTINAGTVTAQPFPAAQVFSAGTTSAGTIGTLVAAPGAGTGMYINSLIINANSGTPEVAVSFALQAAGPQVVNRGVYTTGGGMALSYPHPSYYGTAAAALTWNILSGSGTVSLAVTYTTKGTP